jgi:hypothetical protein
MNYSEFVVVGRICCVCACIEILLNSLDKSEILICSPFLVKFDEWIFGWIMPSRIVNDWAVAVNIQSGGNSWTFGHFLWAEFSVYFSVSDVLPRGFLG